MSTSFASPTRQSESRRRLPAEIHRSSPTPSSPRRPVTPSSASSVSVGHHHNHQNHNRRPHPADSPSRLPRYDHSRVGSSSRKRTRADSSATTATPQSVAYSYRSAAPSPLPLANTRYRLSGGVDTPTANTSARLEQQQQQQYDSADSIPRRRWTSEVDYRPQDPSYPPPSLGALAPERNGHKRNHTSMATAHAVDQQEQRESWRRYVMRVAGGVAGKVWEFSSNAFVGFTSGGGAAYSMTDSTPQRILTPPRREPWVNVERPRDSPVPGAYPQDDAEASVLDQDSHWNQRPAKRLQTRQGSDWVMVDHEQIHALARTPLRPSSRASLGRPQRLSTPRMSAGGRGRAVRYPPITSTPSTQQYFPHDDRRASFASPRSPRHSTANAASGSPGSAAAAAAAAAAAQRTPSRQSATSPHSLDELQRLSARRERHERQQDASMRKMNQQLKDMIRQGCEALATSFEVRDGDDDSGNSFYDVDNDDDDALHDRAMGDAPLDEPEDEGYSEADYGGEAHEGTGVGSRGRTKHVW